MAKTRLYALDGQDMVTPRELMDQLETPGLPTTAHYFITAPNKAQAQVLLKNMGKKVPLSRVLPFGSGKTATLGAYGAEKAMREAGMFDKPGRIFITTLGERDGDVIVQLFGHMGDAGTVDKYGVGHRKVGRFREDKTGLGTVLRADKGVLD